MGELRFRPRVFCPFFANDFLPLKISFARKNHIDADADQWDAQGSGTNPGALSENTVVSFWPKALMKTHVEKQKEHKNAKISATATATVITVTTPGRRARARARALSILKNLKNLGCQPFVLATAASLRLAPEHYARPECS